MFAKLVSQLIRFSLAFVAVLGGAWLFLELISYFFSDSWGGAVSAWNNGAGFWVLVTISAILAFVGIQYAHYFGLRTEQEHDRIINTAYSFKSSNHLRNRENVIANVTSSYIDGVLRQALPEQVQMVLGLESIPGMLQRPLTLVEGYQLVRVFERTVDIYDIFIDSGRAILILGAPGSGKTITLLELCESLLISAIDNASEPIPVVLNLSTWAGRQEALVDWIIYEIHRQYGLSKQIASTWIAKDHLCLLLDGLDEVREDARDRCIAAINLFRERNGAPIVVCSRTEEYKELSERLNLSQALVIQSLTEHQTLTYLTDDRIQLEAVYQAIQQDDVLRELSKTPLMLNIMTVAYRGYSLEQLLPLLKEENERRSHLYSAYIKRVLKRQSIKSKRYTNKQLLIWLRFLADQLTKRSETQFFLEEMQPDWLPERYQRQFTLSVSTLYSILCGALCGILLSALTSIFNGILFGALFSILLSILFGFIDLLRPNKNELSTQSNQIFWRRMLNAIRGGVLFGVPFGTLFGVLFGASGSITSGVWVGVLIIVFMSVLFWIMDPVYRKQHDEAYQGRHSITDALRNGVLYSNRPPKIIMVDELAWIGTHRDILVNTAKDSIRIGLAAGFLGGFLGGLLGDINPILAGFLDVVARFLNIDGDIAFRVFVGVVFGFICGTLFGIVMKLLKPVESRQRIQPNQGVQRSLINFFRGSGLISVLFGIPIGIFMGTLNGVINGVLIGILFGILGGILCGFLFHGGLGVLSHYVLRISLHIHDLLPFRMIDFTEILRRHIIVQRAGGHYRFIHRSLQEHVADLSDEEIDLISASIANRELKGEHH